MLNLKKLMLNINIKMLLYKNIKSENVFCTIKLLKQIMIIIFITLKIKCVISRMFETHF